MADPIVLSRAEIADLQANLNLIFARARSLWKESAQRIDPELQPTGYKLLGVIVRSEGTSAHQLAELFDMDKSVISRQVRILEDLGLVETRPDASDGRQRVLTATEKAKAALAAGVGEYSERVHRTLAGLSHEEIRIASEVFRRMAEA